MLISTVFFLSTANKKKLNSVMMSCIQLLHNWSVFDPDWWDKVSNFPQYPVLMVTLATKVKDINLDRDTGKLLLAVRVLFIFGL